MSYVFRYSVLAVLATLSIGVHASTIDDVLTNGHVDGELRMYQFNRFFQTDTQPDASAFAASALLNVQTGTFAGGFSIGGSVLSAHAFGTHSSNLKRVDTSLMGQDNSLTALGQAYLQYQNSWLLFRGGYQYLKTPWMNSSDSRMVPASYDAIMAEFTPIKNWNITLVRAFRWRSRTSSDYFDDNGYYPSTYHGDEIYGANSTLPAHAPPTDGAWAVGSTYVTQRFRTQTWFYNFLNFGRVSYADGSYVFRTGSGFDPVFGAQFARETDGRDNVFIETGTPLLGVSGHKVDSTIWGINLGLAIPHGHLDAYYNRIEQSYGALGDGAFLSPYTVVYASDPLYTSDMHRGLVEQGPGRAWRVKAAYDFFQGKLQVVAAFTHFTTQLRGQSHDQYLDITYNLDSALKGLSLRDRWERSNGGANNLNPGNKAFTYNRIMMDYKFPD